MRALRIGYSKATGSRAGNAGRAIPFGGVRRRKGMDYTRKKYADMPVGKFWLEIARLVIEGMAMAGEKAFPVRPKGSIQ